MGAQDKMMSEFELSESAPIPGTPNIVYPRVSVPQILDDTESYSDYSWYPREYFEGSVLPFHGTQYCICAGVLHASNYRDQSHTTLNRTPDSTHIRTKDDIEWRGQKTHHSVPECKFSQERKKLCSYIAAPCALSSGASLSSVSRVEPIWLYTTLSEISPAVHRSIHAQCLLRSSEVYLTVELITKPAEQGFSTIIPSESGRIFSHA